MNLKEYASHDGLGLAELVRKKEVTPKELVALAIEGVGKVNPQLNAVLEIFDDRLESAGDVPEKPDAPFAGVPFFFKDLGAGEPGRKQEMGSLLFKGNVIREASYLTEKFVQAGLIGIGRTATPEFGMSCSTESPIHGRTSNPWDPARTAGGSSGGSAASVSAGIVPIAHSSDMGGSTRLPASCCGLVGLKPTRGRVSIGPEFRDYPVGTISEFAVTRTVRDTAALLDALEGPGRDEVRTVPKPEGPYLQEVGADCGTLQVAVWTESMIDMPVHPEVAAAVNAAADTLREMGHSADAADFRFDYRAFQEKDEKLTGALVATSVQHFAEAMGTPLDEEQLDGITRGLLEKGRSASGLDIYGALEAYNILRHSIHEFFNSWDILLTPTITMLPEVMPVENDTYFSWGRYCQFLLPPSVAGNPCISLPLGMSKSGLPIGVQLVTGFGDEATLFRVAGALEEAMPWRDRMPPIHVSR